MKNITTYTEFLLESASTTEVVAGMRYTYDYTNWKVINVGPKMSTCEYTRRSMKGKTKRISNANISKAYDKTQKEKNNKSAIKNGFKEFMIPKKELIPFAEISVAVDQLNFCIDDWETCLYTFDLDDDDNKVRDKKVKDKQDYLRKQEPRLQKVYMKELKKISSKYPLYQKVIDLLDHQNLGFQIIDDVYIKKNSIRGNGLILLSDNGYAPINKQDLETADLTRDELVGIIQSFRALDREMINDYSYLVDSLEK